MNKKFFLFDFQMKKIARKLKNDFKGAELDDC